MLIRNVVTSPIKVGDELLLSTKNIRESSTSKSVTAKFMPRWAGPYTVTECIANFSLPSWQSCLQACVACTDGHAPCVSCVTATAIQEKMGGCSPPRLSLCMVC